MTASATRSAPWQYEWKRPQWLAASDDSDSDFSVDGVPVSSASALLSSVEIISWERSSSLEEEDTFPEQANDTDSNFVLTATLYATGTSTSKGGAADVLLLELMETKQSGVSRLKHRMLRWPGSTMVEMSQGDESNQVSWNIFRPRPRLEVGLVAVTLCRLPPPEDLASASVDAMDVVALLSLGLDMNESSPASPTSVPAQTTTEAQHHTANDLDQPTDLVLACLTSDGRVLLYSPQKILQPDGTEQGKHSQLGDGLASWLLGDAIYKQLEQTVLPLSQPLSVIPLSVPLKRSIEMAKLTKDHLDIIPEYLVMSTDMEDEFEAGSQEVTHLWEETFWDANIEASTAKYHTVDNIPKLMIFAFEFVAVGGQGTRKRRIRRRRKTSSSGSRGSSVSSWEKASQCEEKWETSAKTRSNTTDSGDSSGWWDEPSKRDETMGRPGEKSRTRWTEYEEAGGFITFLSLRYFTESRTVFLPFAPKQLSAVVWGGMHFVIALGEEALSPLHTPLAIAIRVDSLDVASVPLGETPTSSYVADTKDPEASPVGKDLSRGEKKRSRTKTCTIRRFHLIPIVLPLKEVANQKVVAVSSTLVEPPSVVLRYSLQPESNGDLIVTLSNLLLFDIVSASVAQRAMGGYRRFGRSTEKALAIKTHVKVGRAACIHKEEPSETRNTWCHAGQGWALFGVDEGVFFICWEGATAEQGAFVSKVHSEAEYESGVESLTTLRLYSPVVSSVVSLYSASSPSASHHRRGYSPQDLDLPFTLSYKMPAFFGKKDASATGLEQMNAIDDVVKDALESLSLNDISAELSQVSSRRKAGLSAREMSERLVRHCSSWTQLDDTEKNKSYYDNQVPVLVIQLGPLEREHFILSLRKLVVDNATASPFNQVLGWLSQSKDYFTAASVALDLLRDADSLRDLRLSRNKGSLDNERAKYLEGLLDGIVPLYSETSDSDQVAPSPSDFVLTQLADMTVGCLLKGGLSMSRTLENFVARDANYDPGRACLMLVASAVLSLSHDPESIKSVMGADYEWPLSGQVTTTDLLWPLRVLFQVGMARDYLPTVLVLLNAALPNELRRRGSDGELATSEASQSICKSVVSMIVAASATELLLDLPDDATGKKYWPSLDHDTQLELALISTEGLFPMLRQPEVRSWALSLMDKLIHACGAEDVPSDLCVPNDWLQKLCESCLLNAGCDLEYTLPDTEGPDQMGVSESDDGTQRHFEIQHLALDALAELPGSGGLDYELLIPALLLLAYRNVLWHDKSCLSTQTMLDASCYMAGRHRKDEALFSFDGRNVMKQCAMAGNVSAGANLIGGKNGLVLKCCDVLIKGTGLSMDDAEDFILNDELTKNSAYRKMQQNTSRSHTSSPFVLTDEHRRVLWLLDEYVLSVKTFGDFDATHVRGKVDPVFGARSCLRTWLLLSWKETTQATAWLMNWLRQRLEMSPNQVSRKRLACSALTRTLMWPTTNDIVDVGEIDVVSDDHLLANALDMESLFLVQLAQACCGLVESVPPSFAQEVLKQVEANEAGDQRNSSFQVDV